jgi:GMP synthase-like glutamine amidotransferase
MSGLILQLGDLGPPALLGEWAQRRGVPTVLHRCDRNGATPPDAADHAWVAVLGSRFSPQDAGEPQVRDARAIVERAVEADVPVLGLCFGGQLLAAVLGGAIDQAASPELGWVTVETEDPDLVAPGPWLSWHWHRFTTPPGATEIARNAVGAQAFRHGRHLGVQFHPESTIDVVATWADHDRERLAADGLPDGRAVLEAGRPHAAAAVDRAHRLFDRFADQAATNGGEIHGAP